MPRATLMAALVVGALCAAGSPVRTQPAPDRWEVTDGVRRSPSPDPPAWVVKAYEATVASDQ